MTNTAKLAHAITWRSSKQSYLTALLLADRDLVDDCLRAYAYFRWADDVIDVSIIADEERRSFVERQKGLIQKFYRRETVSGLSPEEEILRDLVQHDRTPNSGLRSFIYNFMSVIEFDAYRRGRTACREELSHYSSRLAAAVMDGLQYFIGNKENYPKPPERNLAVIGAHITHMLRDMQEDAAIGILNIPAESVAEYPIRLDDPADRGMREWVRDQVQLAEYCFAEGREYIQSINVLRCKLAGVWYCERFQGVIGKIKRDGYILRKDYSSQRSFGTVFSLIRLSVAMLWQHVWDQVENWIADAPLVNPPLGRAGNPFSLLGR